MAAKRPPITTTIKPSRTTAPKLITDAKMEQREYSKNPGYTMSVSLRRFLKYLHDTIKTKIKIVSRASAKRPS
jgi:hypothetical protein